MTGEEFNNLVTEYGWIVAVSIAVVGFFTFISKFWGSISKFVRVVDILIELPERLKAIEEKIHNVEHEVMTNSGSSLKDSIGRIERHLNIEA